MTTILGKYKNIRKLGKGAFGQVLLVQDAMGIRYALKMISLKSLTKEPYMMEYLEGEMQCMRTMHSPYIMRLVDSQQDSKYKYMLCEYCDGGDLMAYQARQKDQIFTLQRATQILSHVIMGLQLLHREEYIHRDIKSTNILIKNDGGRQLFKLADFGFSKKSVDIGGTVLGTENYMSPEIYSGGTYGFEVDMWSFAVLFFFMLNKEFPFKINPHLKPERKETELIKAAKNFSYEAAVKKTKKKNIASCTPEVEDLFHRMFTIQADERITFFQIRKHPLFVNHFPFIEESSKILYSKKFQSKNLQVKRDSKDSHNVMGEKGEKAKKASVIDKVRNKMKDKLGQPKHILEQSLRVPNKRPKSTSRLSSTQSEGDMKGQKQFFKTETLLKGQPQQQEECRDQTADQEIMVSHRIYRKRSTHFPEQMHILQNKIDRLQFTYQSGIQFLNSTKLNPTQRLNLGYNIIKYFIISMRGFIELSTSQELQKIYSKLRWSKFCQTEDYLQLIRNCKEDLTQAQMKFDFVYGECEHLLPEIMKINQHFVQSFDNQIAEKSFEGSFKSCYRKSTHYTFSRLRQELIDSKTKGQRDIKLHYTMSLLVVCHLINHIFDDVQNLNIIFCNYLVEKKRTADGIDFGELLEWMTRTSCQNLNKISTSIISIYFSPKTTHQKAR